MSKLEEYKNNKATEEVQFGYPNPAYSKEAQDMYKNTVKITFEAGFDAAIALDLPVKFAIWITDHFERTYPTEEVMKGSTEKVLFCVSKLHDFEELPTGIYEAKELYQYWLDNILKIEV